MIDENVLVQVLPSLVMLFIFVWSWTHPPQWISKVASDIRAWTPRLLGALSRSPDAFSEHLSKAKSNNKTIATISAIAEIAPYIPQLLTLINELGLFQAEKNTNTEGGVW